MYLQPLISFREAMRANESGAVAGLDQTANQTWGMSQSLAPSQVSASSPTLFCDIYTFVATGEYLGV